MNDQITLDIKEKSKSGNIHQALIDEITVLPTEVENTIQINITYNVKDTGISDELTLSFN